MTTTKVETGNCGNSKKVPFMVATSRCAITHAQELVLKFLWIVVCLVGINEQCEQFTK